MLPFLANAALANNVETKHSDYRTTKKTVLIKSQPSPLVAYNADSIKAYLFSKADEFGLVPGKTQLNLKEKKNSLAAAHYYFQQTLDGVEVLYGEIIVSVDNKTGNITKVYNNTYPGQQYPKANTAKISKDQALEKSWDYLQSSGKILSKPQSKMFYYNIGGRFALVYKTVIHTDSPVGLWEQLIDAKTGKTLRVTRIDLPTFKNANDNGKNGKWIFKQNKNKTTIKKALEDFEQRQKKSSSSTRELAPKVADGTALVFDPDPRTTLQTEDLADNSPSSAFENAYMSVTLKDLTVKNGIFKLNGPWVTLEDWDSPTSAPSTSQDGNWTAKRGNSAFNDAMTYFHIDQSQRYIQSLGFKDRTGIQYGSIHVDSDGANGDDNSYYYPSENKLAFGHGCVDDNEDADVILHEYGHAINKSINDSWGGGDSGAMGEGFGDYWAGSYSYRTPNGKSFHPNWVFSWDGHQSCWPGRVLNQTHFSYDYSRDYQAHSQVNGELGDELWSTPLFQSLVELTNRGVPHDEVDRIILEAQFGLGHGLKMRDLALATVDAAKRLYPNGPHAQVLYSKFAQVNILSGDPQIQAIEINVQGPDRVVDPGDTVEIFVPVRNTSPNALENVSVVLEGEQSGIEILHASSTYKNIESNSTEKNSIPLKLKVAEDFSCGETINLKARVVYSTLGGSKDIEQTIAVASGVRETVEHSDRANAEIPDNNENGVELSINMENDEIIYNGTLSVPVNITHSFSGDLQVVLVSPKGTRVILWNNAGGNQANLIGSFPETLTPSQSLSAFDGEPLRGTWKLIVKDNAASDVGTVNSWGLKTLGKAHCN